MHGGVSVQYKILGLKSNRSLLIVWTTDCDAPNFVLATGKYSYITP